MLEPPRNDVDEKTARAGLADLVTGAGLFLFALALRLPYLFVVPRYTNEVREVGVALTIAHGQGFPLTNFDPYMGAFFNYLLAIAYLIFGDHAHLARVFIAVFGAATAVLTYVVGKSFGGRWVGIIAGILVAANAAFVYFDGHIPYSNSITPFVATGALWLLWRALRVEAEPRTSASRAQPALSLAVVRNAPYLFAGSLCFGLALQTHPTVIAFLPGLAAVYLTSPIGKRLLRGRRLLFAIGSAAVGYSDLIAYNVMTGGVGILAGIHQRQGYADQRALTVGVYPPALITGVETFLSALGGHYWQGDPLPGLAQSLLIVLTVATFAYGLARLMARGDRFIPYLMVSWLLVLPVLTAYRTDLDRYWLAALPIAGMAMATGIVDGSRFLASRWPTIPRVPVTALLVLLLAGYSWPGLWLFYEQQAPIRPTNAELEWLAGAIAATERPGEPVLIDFNLFPKIHSDGAYEQRALVYLLTLRHIPSDHPVFTSIDLLHMLEKRPGQSFLLVTRDTGELPLVREADVSLVSREAQQRLGYPIIFVRARSYPPTFQAPTNLPHKVNAVFGDQIRLLGYRVDPPALTCAEPVQLRLYWQLVSPVAVNYSVFVHLVANNQTIAQQDSQPRGGVHPTSQWKPGEVVADDYPLSLGSACLDGPRPASVIAQIDIGIYNLQTMQRLKVAEPGQSATADSLLLPTTLAVRP